MKISMQDLLVHISEAPPQRFTQVGGLTTVSAAATHWVDHISTIVSVVLAIVGLAGMIYGMIRQHEQQKIEARREQREIEAQQLLVEMHHAKMQRIKDPTRQVPDTDASPL